MMYMRNFRTLNVWEHGSPEQYFSASELKKGFKDGKIGTDSKFTWTVGDDGKINRLYEVNYYANNSVTG